MKYKSIVKPPVSQVLKSGRVTLAPGESVGEHVTENKEEVLVILLGTAEVMVKDKPIPLQQGATFFIQEGTKHDVKNIGESKLEYVYIVALLGDNIQDNHTQSRKEE